MVQLRMTSDANEWTRATLDDDPNAIIPRAGSTDALRSRKVGRKRCSLRNTVVVIADAPQFDLVSHSSDEQDAATEHSEMRSGVTGEFDSVRRLHEHSWIPIEKEKHRLRRGCLGRSAPRQLVDARLNFSRAIPWNKSNDAATLEGAEHFNA